MSHKMAIIWRPFEPEPNLESNTKPNAELGPNSGREPESSQIDNLCNVCGKIFPRSDNLSRHSKIHKKAFVKCPDCGRKFRGGRHDSLKRHRRNTCREDRDKLNHKSG